MEPAILGPSDSAGRAVTLHAAALERAAEQHRSRVTEQGPGVASSRTGCGRGPPGMMLLGSCGLWEPTMRPGQIDTPGPELAACHGLVLLQIGVLDAICPGCAA